MLKSIITYISLLICSQITFAQNANFLITKNSVGSVELGLTRIEAINRVLQLGYDTTTVDAWNYLLDGGGTGIEVSKDNEVLMFFWTFWTDDLIHGINIVSSKYKYSNGIGTSSTISDLLKANSSYLVVIDVELTSTEYIKDDDLNAQFIFLTNDDNRIGMYDLEEWRVISKPFRFNAKIDWIMLYQASFKSR